MKIDAPVLDDSSNSKSVSESEGDESKFLCTATIQNKRGLHARAAAKFVKLASTFEAEISVTKDGQTVQGRSIMGLMMLAAGPGSEVSITAVGKDAKKAGEALLRLIDAQFGED
jgi:phosphocarrier protein HPr